MHNRRLVFSSLQNKLAVKALFEEVAPQVGDRPGGYTRVLKTGFRSGDSAEMALIELVDFNLAGEESKDSAAAGKKKRTRRTRRAGGASAAPAKSEAEEPETASVEAAEDVQAEVESPSEEDSATEEEKK